MVEVGERQSGVVEARVYEDNDLYSGTPYELHFSMEPGRTLSDEEQETFCYEVVQRWHSEHPNHTVHYISSEEMTQSEARALGLSQPAYEVTIQTTVAEETAALIVGTIGILITIALGLIGAGIYVIVGTGAAIAFLIATVIFFNFVYETGIKCPKCGQMFSTPQNFENHLRVEHADNPEALNRKLVETAEEQTGMNWKELAKWGIVGIAGAMVLKAVIGD